MIFPLLIVGLVTVAGLAYYLFALHQRIRTMSDDITGLEAVVALNSEDIDALIAAKTPVSPPPPPSLQPQIDALTEQLAADHAKAAAALKTDTPPAGSLTVSPSSIAVAVGAAVNETLSVSGGTAPYSFTAPDGIEVDTNGVVTGSVAAAGTSEIGVADSSTPPLTASVEVTAS